MPFIQLSIAASVLTDFSPTQYSTITLTRYTTAYFITLLLCTVTLASLQLSSYVTNRHADITLSSIMKAASVQANLIPIVSSQDGQDVLQLCNGIPSGSQDDRCQTVFAPTATITSTQRPINVGVGPSTIQEIVPTTTSTRVPEQAQAPVSTTSSLFPPPLNQIRTQDYSLLHSLHQLLSPAPLPAF